MKDSENERLLLESADKARRRYEAARSALIALTKDRFGRPMPEEGGEISVIREASAEQERARVRLAAAIEELHDALSDETGPQKADPAHG